MHIIPESGLLNQSSQLRSWATTATEATWAYSCRRHGKPKVSKEVQQLKVEKQRGHELQTERAAINNTNRRVKEWAVVREL